LIAGDMTQGELCRRRRSPAAMNLGIGIAEWVGACITRLETLFRAS